MHSSKLISTCDNTTRLLPNDEATQKTSLHPAWLVAASQLEDIYKQSFSEIGRGDDAIVFDRLDERTVVRIGISCEAFTRFVDFAKKNNCKYLPNILSHHDDGISAMTIMERLFPAPKDGSFWGETNLAINYAYASLDDRPKYYPPSNSELKNIATSLGERARNYNYALDFNRGNILTRHHSCEVVFTDTWCKWG